MSVVFFLDLRLPMPEICPRKRVRRRVTNMVIFQPIRRKQKTKLIVIWLVFPRLVQGVSLPVHGTGVCFPALITGRMISCACHRARFPVLGDGRMFSRASCMFFSQLHFDFDFSTITKRPLNKPSTLRESAKLLIYI